jgi:CubicO group peptidase (beta-lactamase class C family)
VPVIAVAILTAACFLHFSSICKGQNTWNHEQLERAKEFSEQMGTFAFILFDKDSLITAWGDTTTPSSLHSARKSISSAIYAMYTGKGEGKLDPDLSLKELGVDDFPNPLTALQKQAKVEHLMKSTSGINHAAAGETQGMRKEKMRKLGPDPNEPGTIWAYNNWDYNTMIAIFEQQTGISEKEAFLTSIAFPLHMQDVTEESVVYSMEPELSRYPIIDYKLSARDMLKFGRLCLNRGSWEGRQIIPASYFDKIVREYEKTGTDGLRSGHGFFWWVPYDKTSRRAGIPKGTFYADGLGYQQIMVIPAWETVIVHKANTNYTEGFFTWLGQKGFTRSDSVYIVENLQALQDEFLNFVVNDCKDPANQGNEICQQCKLVNDSDYRRFLQMIMDARH